MYIGIYKMHTHFGIKGQMTFKPWTNNRLIDRCVILSLKCYLMDHLHELSINHIIYISLEYQLQWMDNYLMQACIFHSGDTILLLNICHTWDLLIDTKCVNFQ